MSNPAPGIARLMTSDGQHQDQHQDQDQHQGQDQGQHQDQRQDRDSDPAGPQPTRRDKRLYLVLMTTCIGLFVLSWAVLDRYSTTAAVVVTVVALVIPPFAVIIANVASAADRRRP